MRTALEYYKSISLNHTQFKNPAGACTVSTLSAGKYNGQIKHILER